MENEIAHRASGGCNLEVDSMLINFVPDRVRQIIWNDTAKDPFSRESVARRLLVSFDYIPFVEGSHLIVEAITGYNLEEQIGLSEKNDAAIKSVAEYANKALRISKSIHARGSFEEKDLESNLKHIMKEVLGLTNDQYELILEQQ